MEALSGRFGDLLWVRCGQLVDAGINGAKKNSFLVRTYRRLGGLRVPSLARPGSHLMHQARGLQIRRIMRREARPTPVWPGLPGLPSAGPSTEGQPATTAHGECTRCIFW